MFDPFKDFETRGYLRNIAGEKDLRIVKEVEHEAFRANLGNAISYLGKRSSIGYSDFLQVHKILFSSFYPWAGADRAQTAPDIAISKGNILFAHPEEARLAVDHGLTLAHDKNIMRGKAGEIMGLFAFGHPFLDGNGRTILVIHSELCYRAGFSIDWSKSTKQGYLGALSSEIERPGKGNLDNYLRPLIADKITRSKWSGVINALPGLSGASPSDQVEGNISDPAVVGRYLEFQAKRGYRIK